MGRKSVLIVPQLPDDKTLQRFHRDAQDKPLFTIVTWAMTTSAENGSCARRRQLALDSDKATLLEMQRLHEPDKARSWFVNDTVQRDGSAVVMTPMDPLFVLVDAAWADRSRFYSIYDVLSRSHNTWWLGINATAHLRSRIALVFDIQSTTGDSPEEEIQSAELDGIFIKANEEKIMKWTKAKVEKLAETLGNQMRAHAIASNNGGFDANFNVAGDKSSGRDDQNACVDKTRYYRQAIEIVSEYLPSDWLDKLFTEYKIPKEEPKQVDTGSVNTQRFDHRNGVNEKKRPSGTTSAAANKKKSKLANVNRSGMKSLTSFFGKKE